MSRLDFTIGKSYRALPSSADSRELGFHLHATLQCEAGITVLFGASGSGKTLTLDALAGFFKPDEGRIVLDDAILFDAGSGVSLPPQRRSVGYVFQNYALFPHMTIERNLAFGIHKLPPVERGRRIHEQLERFGITSKQHRLPRELSGGEKQRASIARALICQPKLLLLDEPVRGLDYPLRADFYSILRQVRQEHQIPILLVTHDAEEAYLLADKIAVFEAGRVVQFASPQEIFERPVSAAAARLLGIANIFQGSIESLDPMSGGSRIRTAGFTLSLPYLPGLLRGDTLEFCIRREQLRLHATDPATPAQGNFFPAQILSESFTPTLVKLTLSLEKSLEKLSRQSEPSQEPPVALEAEVSRQAYEQLQMKERRRWLVELPPGAVHVFPSRDTSN